MTINFEQLGKSAEAAYAQAREAGWNYQIKLESSDPGEPVLILNIVQPESIEHWIGLPDEPDDIVETAVTP